MAWPNQPTNQPTPAHPPTQPTCLVHRPPTHTLPTSRPTNQPTNTDTSHPPSNACPRRSFSLQPPTPLVPLPIRTVLSGVQPGQQQQLQQQASCRSQSPSPNLKGFSPLRPSTFSALTRAPSNLALACNDRPESGASNPAGLESGRTSATPTSGRGSGDSGAGASSGDGCVESGRVGGCPSQSGCKGMAGVEGVVRARCAERQRSKSFSGEASDTLSDTLDSRPHPLPSYYRRPATAKPVPGEVPDVALPGTLLGCTTPDQRRGAGRSRSMSRSRSGSKAGGWLLSTRRVSAEQCRGCTGGGSSGSSALLGRPLHASSPGPVVR